MDRRFWIVCYDVHTEKRLRRVARAMERFGARVQKSVFECWLTDELLEDMLGAVRKEMVPNEDALRLYTLCETCRKTTEKDGGTIIQEIQQYYIA